MIVVGTLCLVVKALNRPELLGLECVVRVLGCPFGDGCTFGAGCPCVCGCEFKDGAIRGCADWSALLPLLEPPIEITERDVERMAAA